MTRRVLVIGGSLGGLLAAHLLRHAGWHAVVFERNEEALTGRGVGLGTHPQLIAALRRAGIASMRAWASRWRRSFVSIAPATHGRTADRANHERLVAALSGAARFVTGARLQARQETTTE